MAVRIFLFLTGFGLAVSGGVSAIAYLNLLTMGHSIYDYFMFIMTRFECYLLPAGIITIGLSIYFPKKSSEE